MALTVAVDGHLPADTQACLQAVLDDRAGGMVVTPGWRVRPNLTSTEEDRHG